MDKDKSEEKTEMSKKYDNRKMQNKQICEDMEDEKNKETFERTRLNFTFSK